MTAHTDDDPRLPVSEVSGDECPPEPAVGSVVVQVYAVGWLEAYKHKRLRSEWRYFVGRVKARQWRGVRNTFNGYLAEHDGHPHNCGRGWTKRAALRRVDRLCARAADLGDWARQVNP